MKKIVYTRPEDGGVSIVVPASQEAIERILGPMSEMQYISHILERSIPEDAINVRYIDEENIPSNREFRNAWVDVSESPVIDIDSARAVDIVLAKLREEREPLFKKADYDFMRALEQGLSTLDIKERKEALRNLTDDLKELEIVEPLATPEFLEQIKQMAVIPE